MTHTWLQRTLRAMLIVGLFSMGSVNVWAGATCHGKFPNPITDICWSCTLPLSIGGARALSMGQEDTDNDAGNPFCTCTNPPRVGLKTGFWEPVRIAEVTRTPFCMVSLGGIELNVGFDAPRGARPQTDSTKNSFYQVHWYTNPLWFWLEVIADDSCLEQGMFDIAYITEVDPLWADDELTLILNPDVFLFANPIAQAVCAADCVASTLGFGLNSLFWCAGCQGSMYPLNGHVGAHIGGVQASMLLAERMTAKLHREFLIWGSAGSEGLCNYYPLPLMDKTQYKISMTYPIPQTGYKSAPTPTPAPGAPTPAPGTPTPTPAPGTKANENNCCQPYGRSTILWGSGKEFPVKGEDFAYQIFRKRNCCAGSALY
jgi:conjugal transfer pilus assembly protein TraU